MKDWSTVRSRTLDAELRRLREESGFALEALAPVPGVGAWIQNKVPQLRKR